MLRLWNKRFSNLQKKIESKIIFVGNVKEKMWKSFVRFIRKVQQFFTYYKNDDTLKKTSRNAIFKNKYLGDSFFDLSLFQIDNHDPILR